MLKVFLENFSNQKIRYFGEVNQTNYLKKDLQNTSIEFYPQKSIKSANGFVELLKKELIDYMCILKILKNINDDEKVYFFSISPISQYLLSLFSQKYKKIDITIILHSELEGLERDLKPYNLYWWIRKSLNEKNKNIKYIVLGESIKRNLIEIKPNLEQRILSVDHPYVFETMKSEVKNKGYLCFGSIGIATKSKGTEKIFTIAKSNKKDKFKIIGKLEKDIKEIAITQNLVEYFSENTLIDKVSFENSIKEIDYALYFYPENSYKLIASGAIFDAISFEKPIIALKNDYFEYIFQKGGDIGYLCSSFDELNSKIKELSISFDIKKYKKQQENLRKLKLKFSFEFIKIEVEK